MFRRTRWQNLKRGLVFATTLILVCGSVVRAQDTTNLSGTVTDPEGMVIANATVTATNVGNGTARKVTTGENGTYQFNQIPPGKYTLRAEAKGFKVSVQEDVDLVVKTSAQLSFQLEVGSVSETVTVSTDHSAASRRPQCGRAAESATGRDFHRTSQPRWRND